MGRAPGPSDRWPRLSRRDVFTLSAAVTPQAAVELYIAACAWGTGLKARNVARRVRVLTANPGAGESLLRGLDVLRAEGAVAAYESFLTGAARLRFLGPAFFTKVLYFGGYELLDGTKRRPLILDRYVATALGEVSDFDWSQTWRWTAAQYARYLDMAEDLSDRWIGCASSDQVELELFRYGKSLDKA